MNPIVTICVLLFVFQVGFKAPPIGDIPFVVWLCLGFFPWFFFAEALNSASNSIIEYKFLLKNIFFRISYLPIIKILSALCIHLVFIILSIILLCFFGIYPEVYWLQVFYYMFCMVFLLLGLGWLTASLMVFVRDIGNIITIFIQFGFWLTPIFWNIQMLPEQLQTIVKLNPVYYIIQGYRDTFLFHTVFWEKPFLTFYFWFFTLFIFLLGLFVFKKTRPHFADIL